MSIDVIMPNLGLTMEEGVIARWLVAPGERVQRGQPLFEVETDKVSVEVEALATGVLGPVVVEAGRKVAVGTVLARIGETVEGQAAADESAGADQQGSTARPLTSPVLNPRPSFPDALLRPGTDVRFVPDAQRPFSSPRARRIAKERGIDWRRVSGSGPRGRVIERDVLATAALASGAPQPTATHLTTEVDLSRLLDAHRRLALFVPQLCLIDWLARIVAVALDETQITTDLSFASSGSSAPFGDRQRTISRTALKSLARIAAERSCDASAPSAPSAAVFSIHDLSSSRIGTFLPSLVASELGCLALGRIGSSGRAPVSLTCDGSLLTAAQALRLMDRVIDLIEEPAALLAV